MIEFAYVGRLAHRLLEQEDVAAPLNIVAAGTSYFAAATQMSMMAGQNTPVTAVPEIPYWQTMFAGIDGVDTGTGYGPLSATQNVYYQYLQNVGDETSALNVLDEPDGVGAGTLYPAYRYFHSQYSSLYAFRAGYNEMPHSLQSYAPTDFTLREPPVFSSELDQPGRR